VGQENIELLLHPNAFRSPRYIKISEELKIGMPKLERERLTAAGIKIVESAEPKTLVEDNLLFLGEVPHITEFEKGFPRMFFDDNGEEKWDPIEDDTAIVANLKNKGLVILSGCAHAGIVNTVNYAREVTGVDSIFAIMGGFHLTGADFEPVIEPTTDALKQFNPQYIIPTHCTGRKATMRIEQEMPEQFLLNMSGTKMMFSS
jgi:7,8-dihydropterin-6-yl-methyl-4-(beta-D-ribofuranosyl)aminobenzene 5'-phosphate synthase